MVTCQERRIKHNKCERMIKEFGLEPLSDLRYDNKMKVWYPSELACLLSEAKVGKKTGEVPPQFDGHNNTSWLNAFYRFHGSGLKEESGMLQGMLFLDAQEVRKSITSDPLVSASLEAWKKAWKDARDRGASEKEACMQADSQIEMKGRSKSKKQPTKEEEEKEEEEEEEACMQADSEIEMKGRSKSKKQPTARAGPAAARPPATTARELRPAAGYLYLLRSGDHVNLRVPIYKVGRTEQADPWSRIRQYPPNTKIEAILAVDKVVAKEQELIDRMHQRGFTLVKGKEWFQGDVKDMRQVFVEFL